MSTRYELTWDDNEHLTGFELPFKVLRGTHVRVWHNDVELNPVTEFQVSGDIAEWGGINTPAMVITLDSMPSNGDTVNIMRSTPTTEELRIVNFTDGSVLTGKALDTAVIQSLFAAEEASEAAASDCVSRSYPNDSFDAQSQRIINLADPVDATDAVTLATLEAYGLATLSGLPIVSGANNGSFLGVSGGAWGTLNSTATRAALALGTAALKNFGTGTTDLMIQSAMDARYLQLGNDLSEIIGAHKTTARGNLGLGTAAVVNTGTSAGNAVVLDGSARLPAVDGRNLVMTSHPLGARNGGMLDVVWQAKFTKALVNQHTANTWNDFASTSNMLAMTGAVALNNTATDVALIGTTKIELKTSATAAYLVHVNLVLGLASVTAQDFVVGLSCNNTAGWIEKIIEPIDYSVAPPSIGSPSHALNAVGNYSAVNVVGTATQVRTATVSFSRLLTGATGSLNQIAVMMARDSSASPAGVFVYSGDITIVKVND